MYNPEDLHGWYTVPRTITTVYNNTDEHNTEDISTLKNTIKKQEQEIKDLKLTIITLKIEQRFLLKHVRQSIQGGVKNSK